MLFWPRKITSLTNRKLIRWGVWFKITKRSWKDVKLLLARWISNLSWWGPRIGNWRASWGRLAGSWRWPGRRSRSLWILPNIGNLKGNLQLSRRSLLLLLRRVLSSKMFRIATRRLKLKKKISKNKKILILYWWRNNLRRK